MAYKQPKVRSCDVLAGQQNYPNPDTVLDLFPLSAITPGVPRRIYHRGSKIYEEGSGSPIKLVGMNFTPTNTRPLSPEYMDRYIAKLKALGRNYVRIHKPETYLGYLVPYGGGTTIRGNRTYVKERWDEFHLFLYKLKQAGIVYSFNPGLSNMAWDTNGGDRFSGSFHNAGTIVLTRDGNGGIASATPAGTPTLYGFVPPSVFITDVPGSNGSGAEIQANINSAGTVTSYTVIKPGKNYSASVSAANYGGMGRALFRMRFDNRFLEHLRDMLCVDLLGAVSPYTGIPYWQENALFMVDIINESHLNYIMGLYNNASGIGNIPTQLRHGFVTYLADRFGDIATLNAAFGGTSYTGFWDDALRPMSKNSSSNGVTTTSTRAGRCLFVESCRWIDETDVAFYKYLVDAVKATGYKGLIATRDMPGEPAYTKMYAETGATMQAMHTYIGLCDDYTAGTVYRGSGGFVNGPIGAPYGIGMARTLASFMADRPWMFTETGQPLPGIYRGEFGLAYAGYGATHGAVGFTILGPTLPGFEFGTNDRSLRADWEPAPFESDFLQPASAWFGCRMFLRGDIDELPIAKTFTINNRALNNFTNRADLAAADPYVNYRQTDLPPEQVATIHNVRYVMAWDATDSQAIANAWMNSGSTGEAQKPVATRVTEEFAPTDETYKWVITRGNQDVSNSGDHNAMAMSYTRRQAGGQESCVGFDRVSGLFFVDSLRSQAIVASPRFAQMAASAVRKGNAFSENTGRDQYFSQGYAYDKNLEGNQFWHNLTIDYIEDGTFFGVTSHEKVPLSQAGRMIICASSNVYFAGATFQPNGKILAGLTLNGGTGYPAVTEFTFTGGVGMARVNVYSVGGVPTSYKILDGQQGGFTAAPGAVPIRVTAGAGTGLTFTNFVMADAPESDETTINVGFAGTRGWPLQQKRFVVRATLRDVDTTVPWVLYELDFTGKRIGRLPVKRTARGLQIHIDSSKTVQPSVYFELVKGTRYFKMNPNLP